MNASEFFKSEEQLSIKAKARSDAGKSFLISMGCVVLAGLATAMACKANFNAGSYAGYLVGLDDAERGIDH